MNVNKNIETKVLRKKREKKNKGEKFALFCKFWVFAIYPALPKYCQVFGSYYIIIHCIAAFSAFVDVLFTVSVCFLYSAAIWAVLRCVVGIE